jgi:hypothetical protein
VGYQLARLRLSKNIPDPEVELMMRTLAENVQGYEPVVEVCISTVYAVCYLSTDILLTSCYQWFLLIKVVYSRLAFVFSIRRRLSGIVPLIYSTSCDHIRFAFAVFLWFVKILTLLQIGVQFLQSLNHFQRYAYVRLAHAKEARITKYQNSLFPPPAAMTSRTPSNRSESSLGGG